MSNEKEHTRLHQKLYMRMYRNGTAERKRPKRAPECTVIGCEGKHYSRGYCRNHYRKHRRIEKRVFGLRGEA